MEQRQDLKEKPYCVECNDFRLAEKEKRSETE